MALSIFADALSFTEMQNNYNNWFSDQQLSELIPNIAYSSSLHWQLYCDKYPDDRGVLVDWCPGKEKNTSIVICSKVFSFTDSLGDLGILLKKVLSKYVYRRNAFANIPFKFRGEFTEKGKYLFWNKETYSQEDIFRDYHVVSQDEGHISFDDAINKLNIEIDEGYSSIFFNTGFADEIGHIHRRGEAYSKALVPFMNKLKDSIAKYINLHPDEEVLIISDHGMSTINKRVDLHLESKFGKQSKKTYIAYSDSCIMCVWVYDEQLRKPLKEYLSDQSVGHLLTDEERCYFRATNKTFGDFIFILKEGICFSNNWFGKSFKKTSPNGSGMHGFWPEKEARDQMATVLLINGKRKLVPFYSYMTVHELIKNVMYGRNKE